MGSPAEELPVHCGTLANSLALIPKALEKDFYKKPGCQAHFLVLDQRNLRARLTRRQKRGEGMRFGASGRELPSSFSSIKTLSDIFGLADLIAPFLVNQVAVKRRAKDLPAIKKNCQASYKY